MAMTDRERAFGWLVLGEGMPIKDAANVASSAPIRVVENWARRQRRAVLGFYRLLNDTMGQHPPKKANEE